MSEGHNSNAQLKSVIERIENREEAKDEIAEEIRDIYAEAKGNGYDVKALREIVRRRKQDAEKLKEHETILETYMHALGMLSDTPLGQAALKRATA
jgi:uncharacterized protein (UPF0335 family)